MFDCDAVPNKEAIDVSGVKFDSRAQSLNAACKDTVILGVFVCEAEELSSVEVADREHKDSESFIDL